MSVITSLPDVTEVSLELEGWRAWFIDAARAVLRWVRPEGVAIFYQSDIKHHGEWIDKGYLIQRAIELERAALIAHKIVCRHPPLTIAIGRPSYSHMLVARKRPLSGELPLKPGPDVLPDAGHAPWSRAMGAIACRVAIDFVMTETPTRVIVDPFCGRGTVLAVANTMGLDAIGVDISAKRCRAARSLIVGAARVAPKVKEGQDRDALVRGARLFDEGAFFDAHEAWEERWRVESNADARKLLQALIQLAAALHKREVMGAPEAAGRLLARAREKLAALPPHQGMDVDRLRGELAELARVIEQEDAVVEPPKLLAYLASSGV